MCNNIRDVNLLAMTPLKHFFLTEVVDNQIASTYVNKITSVHIMVYFQFNKCKIKYCSLLNLITKGITLWHRYCNAWILISNICMYINFIHILHVTEQLSQGSGFELEPDHNMENLPSHPIQCTRHPMHQDTW